MPTEEGRTPAGGAALAEPIEIKKFSFNLYPNDIGMLKEIGRWAGTNVTQALRSAIATEHFLRKAQSNHERLFLQDPDGQRREIVFR